MESGALEDFEFIHKKDSEGSLVDVENRWLKDAIIIDQYEPRQSTEMLLEKDLLQEVLRHCSWQGQSPANEQYWSLLFDKHFLHALDSKEATDDLLYFVRRTSVRLKEESELRDTGIKDADDKFFVRRREDHARLPPPGDVSINWEETFFLNVLLHKFEYTLEVSIRHRPAAADERRAGSSSSRQQQQQGQGGGRLAVLRKVSKSVFAVPNKIRMDVKKKAEEVEYTYPFLYFFIDNFDEVWRDIVLCEDGEMICVELFASGAYFCPPSPAPPPPPAAPSAPQAPATPGASAASAPAADSPDGGRRPIRVRIFAGALTYEVIRQEYKNKRWPWTPGSAKEFFSLKGPQGKGGAQMAVQVGPEQASSTSAGSSSPPDDSAVGRTVNAFERLGSALRRLSSSAQPTLHCEITSLNMRWDVMIKDVLAASARGSGASPMNSPPSSPIVPARTEASPSSSTDDL